MLRRRHARTATWALYLPKPPSAAMDAGPLPNAAAGARSLALGSLVLRMVHFTVDSNSHAPVVSQAASRWWLPWRR